MNVIKREFPLKSAIERQDLDALSKACEKADIRYCPSDISLYVGVNQSVGKAIADGYFKAVQKFLKRKGLYYTWTS